MNRLYLVALLIMSTVTLLPLSHAQSCGTAPSPRLTIGEPTRVTPGLPNNIRSQPGQSGELLGEIPGGSFFEVLEGPTCSSNMYWWRIQYNGIIGWTAEGLTGDYWLEPQHLIPTDTPTPTFTPSNTPTATLTFTPSHTPTITLTPSTTPTLPFPIQTASAIGLDLYVTSNREWRAFRAIFGGIEMQLVPGGCYNRTLTERQRDEIERVCETESRSSSCDSDIFLQESFEQEVCFSRPFWIDTYEVSNIQATSIGAINMDHSRPFDYVNWGRDYPYVNLDHTNANAHCNARGARLPFEIEWEYVARGVDGNLFVWGNSYINGNAKYLETADIFYNTDGSGIYKPSPYGTNPNDVSWVGAYDMASNVSEFVLAAYPRDKYVEIAIGGSIQEQPHDLRTTKYRGGQWYTNFTGFRCVRDFLDSDYELLLESR